jgi:hypothetical protein
VQKPQQAKGRERIVAMEKKVTKTKVLITTLSSDDNRTIARPAI